MATTAAQIIQEFLSLRSMHPSALAALEARNTTFMDGVLAGTHNVTPAVTAAAPTTAALPTATTETPKEDATETLPKAPVPTPPDSAKAEDGFLRSAFLEWASACYERSLDAPDALEELAGTETPWSRRYAASLMLCQGNSCLSGVLDVLRGAHNLDEVVSVTTPRICLLTCTPLSSSMTATTTNAAATTFISRLPQGRQQRFSVRAEYAELVRAIFRLVAAPKLAVFALTAALREAHTPDVWNAEMLPRLVAGETTPLELTQKTLRQAAGGELLMRASDHFLETQAAAEALCQQFITINK